MSSELLSSKMVTLEENPSIHIINGVPTSVCGVVGICEKGPVGLATRITSPDVYRSIFGSYIGAGDIAQFIDGFFGNVDGGQVWVTRTVHYTDTTLPSSKTSAAATGTALTAATGTTAGSVTAGNAPTYALTPNQKLTLVVDSGAPVDATFLATQAGRETAGVGPYVLHDLDVLTVIIDGGPLQTLTFHTSEFVAIGAATVAELVASLNSKLLGAHAFATSGGTKVTIRSDKSGTGSAVNVTGGTANVGLAYTTGSISGTGNVADITKVTATEVVAVVGAAVVTLTAAVVGGFPRFTSNTTGGASNVQVTNASTALAVGFDNAIHSGLTGAALATLTLNAKYDGAYGNALSVKVAPATGGDPAKFNLQVIKNGVILETFSNLTMDAASASYAPLVVNDSNLGSNYIALVDLFAATPAPTNRPANATNGPLTGGNDGLAGLSDTDFLGNTGVGNNRTGMRCLDMVLDLSLLAVPNRATAAVHNGMLTYCQITRSGQCFAVLDPPANLGSEDMVTYVSVTAALEQFSEFGAIYWPRIKVLNPNVAVFGTTPDGNLVVAPSGYLCGMYARTDASKPGGVYEPPAGIEKGILNGCLDFETQETLDENKRDLLEPHLINTITTGRGLPRYVNSSLNLKSIGPFPSISERRGVIFIEQSVKDGLQFARQRNNDEKLRAECSRSVDKFLGVQMANDAFRSHDPAKAYFIDFGDALNPLAAVFAGKLTGRIGLATQKPAKFIILRFSQDTRAFDIANA